MIHANFTAEPSVVAKKRVNFFKKYVQRASELSDQEKELRRKMPQHVLKLVGNKRLILWKEILSDYGYPDTNLIDDIAAGFKLSGRMPRSHVFKTRTKRPSMSLDRFGKSFECLHIQKHGCQTGPRVGGRNLGRD